MIGIPDIIEGVVDSMKSPSIRKHSFIGVSGIEYIDLYIDKTTLINVDDKVFLINNSGTEFELTVTNVYDTKYWGVVSGTNVNFCLKIRVLKSVFTGIPTTLNIKLYFLHGHPLEIVNTLSRKASSHYYRGRRFPLFALYQDIEEQSDINGYEREANITIIIAVQTNRDFDAPTRQDTSFDAVLYKLYEEFIYHLKKSQYIASNIPQPNRTDRMYWGRNGLYGNEGNVFNEYIDAIEINDLNLKIINT